MAMRITDLSKLTDIQLQDVIDRYDSAASLLHRVLALQVVPGPVDYCRLESDLGAEMDWLIPAVLEWERREDGR
jgi:hypothetical protein